MTSLTLPVRLRASCYNTDYNSDRTRFNYCQLTTVELNIIL